VTKGGFYGYFADRDVLLEAMLDTWERESIDDVLDSIERAGGDALDKARLAGRLTFSRDRLRPIERRYCHATARLTDGQDRQIWYLIEYGRGFVGIGDNVEFCVQGFDRWNVYNAACRVLR
jgi:AcrR family transcriptional regulator